MNSKYQKNISIFFTIGFLNVIIATKLFDAQNLIFKALVSDAGSAREESSSSSDISKENPPRGINLDLDLDLETLAYSYEQLRVDSHEPVTDIDATRREVIKQFHIYI